LNCDLMSFSFLACYEARSQIYNNPAGKWLTMIFDTIKIARDCDPYFVVYNFLG